MKYLKLFKNETEYQEYLNGDDIWLPRVSYIINASDNHTVDDVHNDNGPSYVDFSKIGSEFVQVANGGTMYFTDQVINGVRYTATVDDSVLVISSVNVATNSSTTDVSVYNDEIMIKY